MKTTVINKKLLYLVGPPVLLLILALQLLYVTGLPDWMSFASLIVLPLTALAMTIAATQAVNGWLKAVNIVYIVISIGVLLYALVNLAFLVFFLHFLDGLS